ncbi:MAG: AAA family ATPase [Bacteroidaceae bacterium]|nr:AAA family ATPase [Bacteroidaceae bacterium]MBP5691551.1 AAA family ATPase [Bacteroidaceae bacterium]
MIDPLFHDIMANFPFEATPEQTVAINRLAGFVNDRTPRQVFLLKGYAGTGKTSIISSLVRTMIGHHRRVVLMAPTGRAAKVFSNTSGFQACTIHKKIYRQKSLLDADSFQLDRNLHEQTLFLVDEASMISNEGLSGSTFGTGRLLDDLISYVYSGKDCRLLMLGDDAQLPPVGELESPALSAQALSLYGLGVQEFCLENVMRQLQESGILHNATVLREYTRDVAMPGGFRFKLDGFKDVVKISGSDLIETLSTCYSRDGIDETMVLCRSNKRAITYNNGIRNTILDREDELCRGDSVMIVKNNYYWTERMIAEEGDSYTNIPSFIANGDIAVIRRVRRQRELYGFRFEDATLSFPDYDDLEMEVTLLLDTLHSEAPSLTRQESERLFSNVMEDYADIPSRKEKMKKLRENEHFNALQIKYAYAVTCHKAQGGQWKNIFIDQGFVPEDGRDVEYYRWLYTALTRATQTVYLVNWPE